MFDDKKIKAFRFNIADGWTEEDHRNAVEKIQNHLASTLDSVTEEVNIGWASGRAELNLKIDDAECRIGGMIHLAMRIAVRKVSASMAKALFRKKAEEYRKVNHAEYLSRKVKQEIKDEVQQILLPKTIPTVKSVWVVITGKGIVYAGTGSRTEREQLTMLFAKTFEKELTPGGFFDTEESSAAKLYCDCPAMEFLTDLFRRADLHENADFFVALPFDFICPDGESPCVRSVAMGDTAGISAEVNTALHEKKLLKKVKLIVADDDKREWNFVLLADGTLTGLSLPEGDEMEFAAVFVERVDFLEDIFGWIRDKVQDFCRRAADPEYPELRDKWIAER